MKIIAALFFAVTISAAAQSPQVPHKMSFADMTLTIRDDARREIQKDVDALTQSPKHFNIKAERAKTYFPIIEKIFEAEGVPDDFKYLVLQESALIADAVSVSNAVGFWQFKDFTAIEMGLRVDKEIDERMNIASSTRAAARYIKKNNTFFDNWLYALQAYQMGAGGVMRSVKDTRNGAREAEISSDTYWYVKKFLAHKIAFESVSGKPQQNVSVLENTTKKSLADYASEYAVDENVLKDFNKWTKSGSIPDDRTYIVLIPSKEETSLAVLESSGPITKKSMQTEQKVAASVGKNYTVVNGIRAILAKDGDTPVKLAERANVDLATFLKWNDISYSASIIPGMYYLLGKKRSRAQQDFHTVAQGEDLWVVSQRYGVKIRKLKKYNRTDGTALVKGTTVWLSSVKPKSAPEPVVTEDVAQVSQHETFNWSALPEQKADSVQDVTPEIEIQALDTVSGVAITEQVQESSQTTVVVLDEGTSMDESNQVANIPVDTFQTVKPEGKSAKTEHVVQPKETLYGIAKTYNLGVMDLVKWNNLDLQQGIKPGQVLRLSDPELLVEAKASSMEDIMHEVKASDTLYGIARKYGVTIKDLMEWNDKKDFTLSVGEKLKVKSTQ
jgi:membrane-bound lytic murein transglycosylase D